MQPNKKPMDTEFLYPLLAELPEAPKLTAFQGDRGRELSNSINDQKISNWQRDVAVVGSEDEFAVRFEGQVVQDSDQPFAKRWVVLCPINDDQGQPLLRHWFHNGGIANSMVLTDTDGHFSLDARVRTNQTYALSTSGGIVTLPMTIKGRAVILAFTREESGRLFSLGKLGLGSDKPMTAFFPKERTPRPNETSKPKIEINTKPARTRGSQVTSNKMWECPKCGTILGKGNLGKVWNPGDPIETVGGRATCGGCQTIYQQADVYGGKFDVEEKANKQDKTSDIEGKVALVTFRNLSTTPPKNPTEISIAILKNRYPKAALGKNYVIGLTDSITTADEAVAQYKANVKEKKLPDLGSQFDVWTGKDITGKQVTTLFFK